MNHAFPQARAFAAAPETKSSTEGKNRRYDALGD
jgi:hypothetical protein